MPSEGDAPIPFQSLPSRTVHRSAAYETLLRHLLDLVDVEAPVDEAGARSQWRHRARRVVGKAVARRAQESRGVSPAPEEWFEPLMHAAVHEPDPSFVRELIGPAIAAFGRRRVQLALIAYLDKGTTADAAGAARAWYPAQARLTYLPEGAPTRESIAEHEALSDLSLSYRHTALRRFVTDDDLDMRRCILPGLPLDPTLYPDETHDLVTRAVRIARTSNDDYLRHRVEIQLRPR